MHRKIHHPGNQFLPLSVASIVVTVVCTDVAVLVESSNESDESDECIVGVNQHKGTQIEANKQERQGKRDAIHQASHGA